MITMAASYTLMPFWDVRIAVKMDMKMRKQVHFVTDRLAKNAGRGALLAPPSSKIGKPPDTSCKGLLALSY